MADDQVDISGMPPPPPAESQSDPTADIPTPENLYQAHYGDAPRTQEALDEFMRNPPEKSKPLTMKDVASKATGIPRAAAGLLTSIGGGVASAGAHLASAATNALLLASPEGRAAIPENSQLWEDRAHDWSGKVSKLADYVPATEQGGDFANDMLGLPGQAIKDTAGTILKRTLPDNAYQAVSEVGQDIGTDLQALAAPGLVRYGAGRVKAGIDAVKPKPKPVPDAPLKPDVGEPVSAESLRSQPNPIPPPDGTVAAAKSKLRVKMKSSEVPTNPAPEAGGAAPVAPKLTDAGPDSPVSTGPLPGSPEAAPAPSLGSQIPSQRGSARVFDPKAPKEEGPQETPVPEEQAQRQAHLNALDKLSGGGLPSRRVSAISGDYNATGDDWQMKEVGHEGMRKQIASENAALHTAVDNVHSSLGSEFKDNIDGTTISDRGRVTRGAIQGIEKHFEDATDAIYDTARKQNQGRPIPKLQRVSDYLNDDSNFTNDAEIGLQKAAKQRMERLWSSGDPDKGVPPGSVNAAERLREFLNEKGKNPNAMGIAKELKDHLDMDVAEHGGPGLFEAARSLRRHKYQMLEEPAGIKKLLTPGDSQGINHAIPEHKVMDYIAELPREQHEHVMNVLRAGAHLDPELAKSSAQAIREIQAHMVSRMHEAARDDGGKWNARGFHSAANRYARNMPDTFKDRPDVLKNLQTVSDAGNTLHMDKHYPGAVAQGERTGALGRAIELGGISASSLAHEIPLVGRMVGRGIEHATENAKARMESSARDREVAKRLVDRTGKQRGSVQVMRSKPGADSMVDEFHDKFPETAPTGMSGKRVGNANVDISKDPFDPNRAHLEMLRADETGKGHGHQALKQVTDLADKHGTTLQLDPTPVGKGGPTREKLKEFYMKEGFRPNPDAPGATEHTMTREPKQGGSQLNIGLHIGNEGQPGFRKMSKQEAQAAVESTGAKVTKSSVLTPEQHGVYEPTAVMSTDRPLSEPEMQDVLAKTKQSAIPQRTERGDTSMHIAPGHEETAQKEGWSSFNPDYFREHDGKTQTESQPPLGERMGGKQRGSIKVMNDREDHPDWIPQRLVTSKKAEAANPSDRPKVDLKTFESTPALFEKNMDAVRDYSNVTESQSKKPAADLAKDFIKHVKDNLLALHDAVPDATRERSAKWYDGANKIAKDFAAKHDITDSQASGVLAALSPQKDWYQNVSLAKRVLDIHKGKGEEFYNNHKFDDKMEEALTSRPALNKPEYKGVVDLLKGRSLGDIGNHPELTPEAKITAKALWTRLYDEAHNNRGHALVMPEGDFGPNVKKADGTDAGTGWGSLGEIGKAIKVIESDGSAKAISPLMGDMHKVRNFYNNILSPHSMHDDVTMDTHAVAAGLMKPLSGSSTEVAHNFGSSPGKGMKGAGGSAITGIQGTYPLYAEAYRQAAKERGILPRQMQSITWEAVRGLFPDTFKTAANAAAVDDIWKDYRAGKITQKQARSKIYEKAGGIRPPSWEGSVGSDEGGKSATDSR